MTDAICRWGILGAATIARKNWAAIRHSGNATVVAVASRSEEAANRFIDECSAEVPQATRPLAMGSYDELLARDDIDAVYIPLPTALRYTWVVRAARAGKHVLGEKPAAASVQQVADMLRVCEENQVQYMDGVMFMHSQRLPLLRTLMDHSENFGQLRRIDSQFSFSGDEAFQNSNIRANSDLEPFGCFGDLGWYCLRFFLWARGGVLPVEVRARTLSTLQSPESPEPVPGQFSGELVYSDGITANFYCSFVTAMQQWVHLSGSQGCLRVDDFVLPYFGAESAVASTQDFFNVENCSFRMEQHTSRHAVREYDSRHSSAQEVNMIRNFSQVVLSGKLDSQWPQWTLDTQRMLDACFESSKEDGKPVTFD